MRILITGSSGFIGSHLVSKHREQGDEIFCFDVKESLRHDIQDGSSIKEAFNKFNPDAVYHCAGQVQPSFGEERPYADIMLNLYGMINVLKAMEGGDAKMVYTSTGAVYGLSPLPHKEDMLCKPVCNYGVSKLAAEMYLQKWVATEGIDAKIVRFSSVYGPGRHYGPINIFLEKAVEGRNITVFGSGSQTRDFVHVDDVVQGMNLVLDRGGRGEVYNVGTGKETSVQEVAKVINNLHPEAKIEHKREVGSVYDLPRSWFDITKIQGLGYIPRIDLDLGIKSLSFQMGQ